MGIHGISWDKKMMFGFVQRCGVAADSMDSRTQRVSYVQTVRCDVRNRCRVFLVQSSVVATRTAMTLRVQH